MDTEYTLSSLLEDITFARAEFGRDKPTLRYVAAINRQASLSDLLEAAEQAGYKRHTAEIAFRESRNIDMQAEGLTRDADWRLIEKDVDMTA